MQNAFMQVGEPDAEFRPHPLRLFGRVLIGLVIAGVGLGICAFGFIDLEDVVECLVFGAALIVVGLGMAWKVFGIWGQCLFCCPNGMVRRRGLKVEACRWEQIKIIRETEGKSSYEIIRAQGESWTFDDDHTQEIAGLAGKLRDVAGRHSIRWEIRKEEKKDE